MAAETPRPTGSDEPRDLALEIPLLVVASAGVVFFAGVHRWFIAGHFIAALALAFFALARSLVTGRLRLAAPPVGAAVLAVIITGAFQAANGLSIAPDETRETLLRYGVAAIVFFLSAFAARSESAVRRLGLGAGVLVAFEVLYGIAEHFGGREYILFWPKLYPGVVSGTFHNRDHFAGVLVLATPFLLGLAQSEPWRWHAQAPRLSTRLALALDQPGFWRGIACYAAAGLGALGVVLSLSRGGVLAIGFAFVVYALLATRGKVSANRTRLLALGAFGMLVVLGAVLYGRTDPLLARFATSVSDATQERGRVAFVRGTVELIEERPLTGSGLGTFERNFTHVQRSWYEQHYLEHAHCDVLQLPSEVGIPVAAIAGLLLLACLASAVRRSGSSTVTCGLVAAVAGAWAHALVDFTLQREGPLVFAGFVLGLLAGPRAPRVLLMGKSARIAGPLLALALLPLVPYPLRVLQAELLVNPTVLPRDDVRPSAEKLVAIEKAIELRPERAVYRRLAVQTRLDAFVGRLDAQVREAVVNLGGDSAPEGLASALRQSIAARAADEAAAVQSRSMADLRAAAASDPRNARVLSLLALITLDPVEARRAADEAVSVFPYGVDVIIESALGRLKLDRRDEDAAKLLARGLALDPGLLSYAAFHATALQLERELARALPDASSRREWARRLVAARRLDLLGDELEALARLEDGRAAVAPVASASGKTVASVRPDAWLDKPDGFALERLNALVLRLAGRRAGARLPEAGTLLVETSLVPGRAPAFVCVLHEGKHLGHVLVAGDWATARFACPGAGWVELVGSLKHHALVGGEPDEGVLVRDVSLVK